MHPRTEAFADAAASDYDLAIEVHEFESGTKTAADAAAAIGCEVAQIASSLVFDTDDGPIVVVTSGANRVDEERLAATIGASDVQTADPETVRSATGYGIGGVPPFCHERSLPVYVDQTLLDHDTVWAAAGTPEAVFPIDPETLVAVTDATPLDVAE